MAVEAPRARPLDLESRPPRKRPPLSLHSNADTSLSEHHPGPILSLSHRMMAASALRTTALARGLHLASSSSFALASSSRIASCSYSHPSQRSFSSTSSILGPKAVKAPPRGPSPAPARPTRALSLELNRGALQ